jgi:glycerol-3-phosphate dehydrogenase
MTRTRLNYESPNGGIAAAPAIADIMAPLLGWDETEKAAQIDTYTGRVRAERAAWNAHSDAEAEEVRLKAEEPTPMRVLT